MNVSSIKNSICSAVLVSTVIATACWASVSFTNSANSFLMDNANARLSVSNPAKVIGFSQRSIVKAYGNNTSNAWPETYTSNAIIGNASITGVTLPARTNLIDANSNAINVTGVTLRATSNLLLYTARTYSSSIWVLNRRTDSTNLLTRTTSNAVNLFYTYLPVPTTDSIDGTQFMRYHTAHHVFHNNGNAWTIRGWVRFNNGFTVMPLGSVIMDTLVTVSGGMDLRDTGTLILNNDLYLAHNVTLTNGGNIEGKSSMTPGGQANTIFMGGDLTLASTTYARTLHITGDWSPNGNAGDLIIDGCGHTLDIQDRAQIFVDQNVTLTLRNMTIRTGPKSLMAPPIQLASLGSKLALDNVMFDLGADFQFVQGQIFVHNEVAVTGTSAFIYTSPKPSYITTGATLSFESGTTFSVAPATYTDVAYTASTSTSNNFLVFADASSALSLNGCSLKTTFTGLRLSRGMVLFDNKVAIDTTAGMELATTGTSPVAYFTGVATGVFYTYAGYVVWSPDGKFLAVSSDMGNFKFRIYRFDGINAPTPVGASVSVETYPNGFAWSPDRRFLAISMRTFADSSINKIQVFRFNGSTAPTPVGSSISTAGNAPYDMQFSPDGRFLVVDIGGGALVQVFRFNGVSTPTSVGTVVSGTNPSGVRWSPDGRFIAFVNANNPSGYTLQVCSFDGKNAPVSLGTVNAGYIPISMKWTPDGRCIYSTNFSNFLYLYTFTGSGVPTFRGSTPTVDANPTIVTMSPDGKFMAVLISGSNYMRLYRANGIRAATSLGTVPCGGSPTDLAWSPDGRFLAVYDNSTVAAVRIYRCNYVYSGQPQGFSNGLLFGDSAKGAAYDADVRALGGATVKINGMVRDDSV